MKRLTLAFAAAAAALFGSAHAEDLHIDLKGSYPASNPNYLYETPYATPNASFELSCDLAERTTIPSNSNLYFVISNFAYRLNGKTLVSGGQTGARNNERGVDLVLSPGSTSAVDYLQFDLSPSFTYDPPILDVSVDPRHPWVSVMGAVDGSHAVTFQPGTYTPSGGEGTPAIPYQHATLTVSPVPEPSTLALLGAGAVLAAAGAFLRRQGRGAPRES